MYLCKICNEKLETVSSIANHNRWKHKQIKIFKCEKCLREFRGIAALGCHKKGCGTLNNKKKIQKEENRKLAICPKCNFHIGSNRLKHFNSCNGFGPRRRILKIKLSKEEISKKISNSLKQTYKNDPSFRIRVSNSLKKAYKEGRILKRDEFNPIEILRREKISKTMKLNPKSGGLRSGSGRGIKGWYKEFYFRSSWELAYIVYNLENKIKIYPSYDFFKYNFEDKERKYYPDFILEDGSYVEIKGYFTKQVEAKIKQFPKDKKLILIGKQEIQKYLDYVISKYGKDFFKYLIYQE